MNAILNKRSYLFICLIAICAAVFTQPANAGTIYWKKNKARKVRLSGRRTVNVFLKANNDIYVKVIAIEDGTGRKQVVYKSRSKTNPHNFSINLPYQSTTLYFFGGLVDDKYGTFSWLKLKVDGRSCL